MSASSPLFDLDFFLARVPSTLGIMLRVLEAKTRAEIKKRRAGNLELP
jgi:hypothetical protein